MVVIACIAVAIGAGILMWRLFLPRSLCGELSCIQLSGQTAYRLNQIYTDSPETYRALYAAGNRYIRIDTQRSNPTEAATELDASVLRMKALFEKAPAPYPGDISDAIVCDPAFTPSYDVAKLADGTDVQYFIGYLNDRMTFGSCSQDQAVYKGLMAFLYCPAAKLTLRIEFIAPAKEFMAHVTEIMQQFHSMRCGK